MPFLAFALLGWIIAVLNPPRYASRRPRGPRHETLIDMGDVS